MFYLHRKKHSWTLFTSSTFSTNIIVYLHFCALNGLHALVLSFMCHLSDSASSQWLNLFETEKLSEVSMTAFICAKNVSHYCVCVCVTSEFPIFHVFTVRCLSFAWDDVYDTQVGKWRTGISNKHGDFPGIAKFPDISRVQLFMTTTMLYYPCQAYVVFSATNTLLKYQ